MAEANIERVSITVSEAAASTGLKPAAIYRSVSTGEIESTRLGGRILILVEPVKKKFRL